MIDAASDRGLLVGVLSVALVSTLAACTDLDVGGPSPSDNAQEYAATVCGELVEWTNAISEASENPVPRGDATSDISAIESFLDDAAARTRELEENVRNIEVPDLNGASEMHSELVEELQEIASSVESWLGEVQGWQTDPPANLEAELEQLATEISTETGDVVDRLEELKGPAELESAFDSEGSCALS